MKKALLVIYGFLMLSYFGIAQNDNSTDTVNTSLTHKEKKAERKANRQFERKALTQHFRISGVWTYADINSTVRFEGPYGLLSTQVDFERHLGLEDRKSIFSGSLLYRITPRSGLFASYYRLYRSNSYQLDYDVIFEQDTLNAGEIVGGYFNTDVFSIGYMLSILKNEDSFLGAYFNVYLLNVKAGITSEVFDFHKSTGILAPLPNFGLLAIFQLKKWLAISGGVGMFFLNTQGQNGSFNDIHALVVFSPAKWVGISVGYYMFDVKVSWPVEDFRAHAAYNYSGPSVGLSFKF